MTKHQPQTIASPQIAPTSCKQNIDATTPSVASNPREACCARMDAARARFNEGVALLRAFNLIDNDRARQEVLALARRHAKLDAD